MEKPLLFSAVIYLCGIGLGAGFSYFPLFVLGLAAGGLFISLRWLRRGVSSKETIAMGWGWLLLGMLNFQMASPSHPPHDLSRLASGERMILRGRIDAPLQHRSGSDEKEERVLMRVKADEAVIGGRAREVKGRLRLSARGFPPEVEYGDEIEVEATVRPLSGLRNPGGFDYVGSLERQGIRAHATVRRPDQVRRVRAGGNPVLRKVYNWREEIRLSMDRTLSLEASAVLKAMIIGESGSLTPEIREAFMASGTTHILSISGSHLGLVAVVVFSASIWAVRRLPAPLFLRLGRRWTPSPARGGRDASAGRFLRHSGRRTDRDDPVAPDDSDLPGRAYSHADS